MSSEQGEQRVTRVANSIWRMPDYVLLWSGHVCSTLGSAATSIAYPLLILFLTDSPAAAGIAGVLRWVPYLVLSLPFGALVDRWDRGRVMVLCQLGRGLAMASIPVWLAFETLTIWHIYLVCLVEGILFVLFNIAEAAVLPRVVPSDLLPQASGANEAGFGAALVVGPLLGTFLYQSISHAAPFVVGAVCFVASLLSLLFIKTSLRVERPPATSSLRAEISQGVRWLWAQQVIFRLALVMGGLNMVSAAMPLIFIVIAKGQQSTDAEIGLILSLGGLGGVVGSLFGAAMQRRFGFGRAVLIVLWGQALLFPLLTLLPGPLSLGIAYGAVNALYSLFAVMQFSYRISLIPANLQGRVNSSCRLLAFSLNPLGAALSGMSLEYLGAVATVVLFTAWIALLALWAAVGGWLAGALNLGRLRDATSAREGR